MEEEKGSLLSFYFITASLVLLSYISLRHIRRALSRPQLPPGPTGLPLLGSVPFLDPQLHSYFANLAETYGPIFSIKLGLKLTVVVSSPSVAREILRDHDTVFANRDVSEAGRVLSYGAADMMWNPNGPTWRMLRKVTVHEMLGVAPLESTQEIREKELTATICRLRGNVDRPVNIGLEIFITVLNVITTKLWGGKFEEDNGFQEDLRVFVHDIFKLLTTPNISDLFPILRRFDLQGVEAKGLAIRERFDQLFEDVIRKKKEKIDGNDGNDFLDALLRMERESGDVGGKTPFTRNNLKAVLLVIGSFDLFHAFF